jgi:HAD superfamily hydrolase (TIGR01490 family)
VGVAFFDLDRTLITVSSGHLWFRRERAQGRLSVGQAVEAAMWGLLYNAGLMQSHSGLDRAVRALAGQPEAEMIARSRSFYDEEIAQTVAPGAHAVLAGHRESGDKIVLLTSSTNYVADCIRDDLGLDAALAMRLESRDGLFTGRIEQLCFGAAKVAIAERWAQDHGIELSACSFYSDSYTDLPMLERVGTPIAVHPDRRLLKIARKRGWTVLDWLEDSAA